MPSRRKRTVSFLACLALITLINLVHLPSDNQFSDFTRPWEEESKNSPQDCIPSYWTLIHLDETQDLSWLRKIKLGKWLGSGAYSDTFSASFSDRPTEFDYIIKFSGNYEVSFKKHSQFNFAEVAANSVDVLNRLSPHPDIPKTIYFASNITNPFRTGHFSLPDKNEGGKNSTTTAVNKLNHKRIGTAPRVSVIVSERVFQTHRHMNDKRELIVPPHLVRCFWRRFFEMLDYAHNKRVILTDTKLWNVMLQDGDIKFFDWNEGKIFESVEERRVRKKLNLARPAYKLWKQGSDFDAGAVHHWDTHKMAKRLSEFLDDDKRKRIKNDPIAITREDRDMLKDLRDVMQEEDPPTLRWLLDNHEYFTEEESSSCTLKW